MPLGNNLMQGNRLGNNLMQGNRLGIHLGNNLMQGNRLGIHLGNNLMQGNRLVAILAPAGAKIAQGIHLVQFWPHTVAKIARHA